MLHELLSILIPGLVAVELFRAVYPAAPRNWPGYVGWAVVWGAVAAATAQWFDRTVLDATVAATSNVLTLAAISLLVATGAAAGGVRVMARMLRFWLARRSPALQWLRPDHPPVWVSVNQPYVNDDWAVVFLLDGAIYLGWVAQFGFDPRREEQDFVLQDARRLDEDLGERYHIAGSGVYLNTRAVARIEYWTGEIK
jgi:hypothetical protein